jgi:hypothetical protein
MPQWQRPRRISRHFDADKEPTLHGPSGLCSPGLAPPVAVLFPERKRPDNLLGYSTDSPSRCHGLCGSAEVSLGSAPVDFVHSGQSPDRVGVEIIANGPALRSPFTGVGFETSKPQDAASLGLLNQGPMWNVFVGETLTVPPAFLSASNPKI